MSLPPHQLYRSKLFPGSSHYWALSRFERLDRNTRILDIGSGSGVMGQELGARGFESISAVEVSPAARDATTQYYRAIVPSLAEFNGSEKFDTVLMLDVLEHMPAPEDFLKELLPLLRSGGKLLISVPNVAHWAIRLMLLAGYFDYMERGPLDKTHLRFFTVRTLAKMLANYPEFKLTRICGSVVPLELMLPSSLCDNGVFKAFTQARIGLANLLPSIFGYQLLAEVEITKHG